LHYEYELDKSTGEVIRKETNGWFYMVVLGT
jgi:hypothetical protein